MENLASEAVKILVKKLITTVTEEFKLVRGFKQEMERLKESLLSINEVLEDAHQRQVNDKAVSRWLDKLENLAYDADDVLDEIKYENLRRMVEISNERKPKGCLNITFYPPLAFRWKMAHKIQNINVKLNRINDEANRRGFERRLTESAFSMPEVKETDSYTADPVFIGRENDVSNLAKKITSPLDEVISVFSIVGMGGLGKTTLARKIFNNQSIESHFDKRIWICVSDNFDVKTLFKKILESLEVGDNFAEKSRQEIVKRLHDKLEGKKYLLVLDDLWNNKREDWNIFKDTLLGVNPNRGNAIVVTTRGANVALIVNPREKYDLQLLKDDDCWSIIRAKTFGDKTVPEQFQTVGKAIAQQCRGVPLAAKMIGGVLAGKEINEWISVHNIGPSRLEGDGDTSVMAVLKISFDRLPSPSIKACFAYCSVFPKDSNIDRKMLIRLWMAEGLLPDIQGYDIETTGNRIFKILFQNSFFQEPRHDKDGNIEYCKMHDLVHDLACSISKTKSHIADHDGDVIPRARYLTILKEAATQIGEENTSYLRTLISFEGSMPCKNLQNLRNLRVLLLFNNEEDCRISIPKLINLRYLLLLGRAVTILPDSFFCKLYNLQTLYIKGCLLEEIPMLGHLPFLKNLKLSNLSKVTSIKPSFYGESYCSSTRVSFPSLKSLEIEDMDNLKEWTKAQMSRVKVFPCLEYLLLSRCGNLSSVPSLRDGKSSLKTLIIMDCPILRKLVDHLYNFQSLEALEISGCTTLELRAFPNEEMCHFPLRRLEIFDCDCVRPSEILVSCTSLQYLRLSDCHSLTSLSELTGMESLQRLHVSRCYNLTMLPDLSRMRLLEHLEVYDCRYLVSFTELSGMESLQRLHVSYCPNLTMLPDLSRMKLLQRLQVHDCRNLVSFSELRGMESLQFLEVTNCSLFPELSGVECFNSLRDLKIGNYSQIGNAQSSFCKFFDNIKCIESLKNLVIVGEGSWTSLPDKIQYLTSLNTLQISGFGNEALPDWLGSLSSLQELDLNWCRRLLKFPSKETMQRLTKLREIRIFDCEQMMNQIEFEWSKISHIPQIILDGGTVKFEEASSPTDRLGFSIERNPRKDFSAHTSAVRQLTGSLTAVEGLRFSVVCTAICPRFNEIVTKPLLEGALDTFKKYLVKEEDIDVVHVPGSFEISVVAEKRGKSRKYQAILCIGAVIRGDTTPYDAVANSAASGVLSAGLNSGVPCIFGVLTCDDMDQALNRAGGKAGNKGSEAALTAIEMASLFEHHLKS